jgi:hypothetical protein
MVTVSVGLNADGTDNAYAGTEVEPTVTEAGTVTVISDIPAT